MPSDQAAKDRRTGAAAEALIEPLSFLDEVFKGLSHQPWWRGQGRDLPLVPSVYRVRERGQGYETNIANKFVQRAQTRFPNCPPRGALAPWLFLMQHYRLPTRLLDWTESFLAALFFAVEEEADHDADGVLWALDPYRLNAITCDEEAILQPGHWAADSLIQGAFGAHNPTTDPECIALITEEIDLRMLVQQSALTIHKRPAPLDAYPKRQRFLRKYTIAADAKPELLTALMRLGVRRRTLFPDLENLAADLRGDSYPSDHPVAKSTVSLVGRVNEGLQST